MEQNRDKKNSFTKEGLLEWAIETPLEEIVDAIIGMFNHIDYLENKLSIAEIKTSYSFKENNDLKKQVEAYKEINKELTKEIKYQERSTEYWKNLFETFTNHKISILKSRNIF